MTLFKLMIQILVIVQSACPGSSWITNLVAYIARANHGFYSILKSNWRHCYPPPLFPTPLFLTPPLPPPPSSFWMGCHSIIRKSQRISSGLIKRSPVKQKYTVYPFILLRGMARVHFSEKPQSQTHTSFPVHRP